MTRARVSRSDGFSPRGSPRATSGRTCGRRTAAARGSRGFRLLRLRLVLGAVRGFLLPSRGGPAAQESELVGGGGARLGGVGGQGQARLTRQLERVEGEVEIADDRVVEVLGPGAVQPDVVRRPAGTEGVAADGELSDEVAELAVVGIAAGF